MTHSGSAARDSLQIFIDQDDGRARSWLFLLFLYSLRIAKFLDGGFYRLGTLSTLGTLFVTPWLRFLMPESEMGEKWRIETYASRIGAVFACILLLEFTNFIPEFGLWMGFAVAGDAGANTALWITITCAFYVWARLGLAFPAIIAGERRALVQAWKMSRGYSVRITLPFVGTMGMVLGFIWEFVVLLKMTIFK